MSRVAATAIAVLLLGLLVEGAVIDLGDRLLPGAVALALAGVGLGVIWRCAPVARGASGRTRPSPALAAGLAALLVPLRGALCELPLALFPAAAASLPARLAFAAATIVAPSALIGHLLGTLLHGSLPLVLVGVLAGEALIWAGATGWASAWIVGPAGAGLLLLLGSRTEARVWSPDERRAPASTLLIGGAVALFVSGLARVVPSYTAPSTSPATDALAALLAPAMLVAWPASLLGRGRIATATLGGGGALLLAVALFHAVDALALFLQPMVVVETTRSLHVMAARLSPWLNDWWLWLLSFAALGAASLGLSIATLPARAAGGLACGAGAALLATQLVSLDAVHAPATWLLVGSALAAAAAPPLLLGRHGWWLAPAAIAVLIVWPVERRPGYDEVRRPGELAVEGFERTPLLDVMLYSAPASSSVSVEGRLAARTAFTSAPPAVALAPDGTLATNADAEGATLGLQLGGLAWSPGHDPLGPAGSVGRLTRVFGVKGRALVAGPAAELFAADLHDAGLLDSAVVASDAPLGGLALVILASRGSGAWKAASVREPFAATRAQDGYDTVLLAPSRASWPGAETLGSEEWLERVAARLTAAGRCLLWLDTTDLDAAALRARLAGFGQVFGERAAAFVEPRDLDPPLVLLVGWRGEEARPSPDEIEARLEAEGDAGRRVPLRSLDDLGALMLRDGAGLAAAGEAWGELRASNLASASRWTSRGWAAVTAVADPQVRPASILPGAAAPPRLSGALHSGLAEHALYEYDLVDLNETVLEVRPDVDWRAFDREVEHYAQAARENPDDPLLQYALASLLEPLAMAGDYGRFARAYQATGARSMRSVRLALLEAWVQQRSLEPEGAEEALRRAREWAGR